MPVLFTELQPASLPKGLWVSPSQARVPCSNDMHPRSQPSILHSEVQSYVLSLAGTPRRSLVSHRPLCQQNRKRCLLWDFWEEFPQVSFFFFLRRRKREMLERSTTFVASEGGCPYIIYGPALAISELSGGRRTAKRTSRNTKMAARVSKDVIEPLRSSTLEPLCQAGLLNMRLKCPFGLRGLWAPRIPLAPLGSGDLT